MANQGCEGRSERVAGGLEGYVAILTEKGFIQTKLHATKKKKKARGEKGESMGKVPMVHKKPHTNHPSDKRGGTKKLLRKKNIKS